MQDLRSKLEGLVELKPLRGEIWYADGKDIELGDPNDPHKDRPVLVFYCGEDYELSKGIPIIPISRSGERGIVNIPIFDGYAPYKDYELKKESKAITDFPQRIKTGSLIHSCGEIGGKVLLALMYKVCGKKLDIEI